MSLALLNNSSSLVVSVKSRRIHGHWAPGINSGWGGGWKTGGGPTFSGRSSRQAASSSSSSAQQQSQGSRSLALDVVTTEDAYLIYADIPGVSKSDLSIKCSKEQRVLTITGSRPTPTITQDYRQQQRPFRVFERSWPLPVDADAVGVSAKVSDGVLQLTVKRLAKQQDEGQDIFIN